MNRFQMGELRCLICTDMCARGLDIRSVTGVVNFEFPIKRDGGWGPDPENYAHRIGRTGRGGDQGDAYTLLTQGECACGAVVKTSMETAGFSIPEYITAFASGRWNVRDFPHPETIPRMADESRRTSQTVADWRIKRA